MKVVYTVIALSIFVLLSCGSGKADKNKKKEKQKMVLVETPYGEMKIALYNETPKHRDNFIKLVEEGFYDSLLFHRVIKDFMIQGGDPDSKNAPEGMQLGNGGPGYQIDAEFVPSLFHKKGALAAARMGDNENPEKKSSGSQFYIVQGRVLNDEQLNQMEEKLNFPKKRKLVFDYINQPENAALKAKIDSLQRVRAVTELNNTYNNIAETLEEEYQAMDLFYFSEKQREAYKTIGGTPHLDMNYTVFGEVVEGLNIIDSIAQVKTDRFNRPMDDVPMKIKVVKK